MKIRIFQVNPERDTKRTIFLGSMAQTKILGNFTVDKSIYDEVYQGEVMCEDLDDVFEMFNIKHPEDYKGRSLSVTDMIEVIEHNVIEPGFYFVDSFGFKRLKFQSLQMVEESNNDMGNVSDGYHTFNELYHHRAVLFSVICSQFKDLAWKSKKHDDGSMFDNMFIVGINTPEGQATYHYDVDPYWDMFDVKELEYAPKWDGHTPEEAIQRISSLKGE